VDALGMAASSAARSARPRRAAMRARRSQAAQHITLEKVCTRALPRSSHSPASGWSCSAGALAERFQAMEQGFVAARTRRWSKKTCVAARMAEP
jgi:hypothetical protein